MSGLPAADVLCRSFTSQLPTHSAYRRAASTVAAFSLIDEILLVSQAAEGYSTRSKAVELFFVQYKASGLELSNNLIA